MELKRKNLCPLLKTECIGLDCAWFMELEGDNPQDKTSKIKEWNCAIVWQVYAGLELAKRASGGADGIQKAVESFRNEMVQSNNANLALMSSAQQLPQIPR